MFVQKYNFLQLSLKINALLKKFLVQEKLALLMNVQDKLRAVF